MTSTIPPGFERCPTCGEYNGTTRAKYLTWETEPPAAVGGVAVPEAARDLVRDWKREDASRRDPEQEVGVVCLCHGLLCRSCGVTRIHRPISNSYDPASNTVGHSPWFMGMAPCWKCRAAPQPAGRAR